MLTSRRSISVAFGECDPSGIVYNPNYFIWLDVSVHALLASAGLTLKGLMADTGLEGIPVVDYRCRFLGPARWGDELLIETAVTALHRCAFDLRHQILNGEAVIVDCAETRVCTAIDPQEGRPRGFPLPERLAAALSGEALAAGGR
jgi:4-hydroxybenzoyl-CoA thioesterase